MQQTGRATADDAIRILNEALELDPAAVNRVFMHYPCNEVLGDHPTIQVGTDAPNLDPEEPTAIQPKRLYVSALGLLNGIFGLQPGTQWGWIEAVIDTDARPPRIIRFQPCVVPEGARRRDVQQS